MSRDRIIETYVERLLAWKDPITVEKLDDLAAEVGLSPEDIAAVRKQAQNHLARGKNYLDFDCVEDAIEKLTQAASLDPLNLDILQTLAAAYENRYQQDKKPADKIAAIQTAKRCLDVAPDDAKATKLIASLEASKKPPLKRIMGGLATGLILVGALGSKPIIKTLLRENLSSQAPQIDIELDIPDPELDLDGILDDSTPVATTSTPSATVAIPEIDIPVLFEQPGLTLDPRLSRLNNYDDSSFYKLQGVLLNESNQEIDSLRLQVEYLDKDSNVLLTESTMALDPHEGIMRPGDHHAFDLVQKVTPAVAQLRLTVTTLDQLPAPASYPTAQTIDYSWPNAQQNPGLKFDLTRRQENFSTHSGGSGYLKADWAITNTGDQAIRQLKLEVTFYAENNRSLGSKDVLVVYGSDAALLPGEVRPVYVIENLKDTYKRYEIKVVETE